MSIEQNKIVETLRESFWQPVHMGGGTHVLQNGRLVLSGFDGDLPSEDWFLLAIYPSDDWFDAEPLQTWSNSSAEYDDGETMDLWESIKSAEALAV